MLPEGCVKLPGMARKLRIQYEGAIYHVTFRGNARREIFADDRDRERLTERLGESAEDFGDWFASRDANFKDRHAIPTLASYDFDSFLEFIEKRRAILVEKLKAFSI